jgi:hypothetical protein
VTLSSGQVESWDVVGSVSVLQLDGAGTSSESKQLMTHANSHDWDLAGLHELSQVVDSLLAVGGVTWAVRDEDTVEVVRNLVDWVVVWKTSDGSATADETTEDVLLDTTINQSNVEITNVGADVEWSLGRDSLDQINGFRVNVCLVLIGIIFLTDRDAGQRRTLLSEKCDNVSGVDAANGWHALSGTPLGQTLNGGPVTVFDSVICHHHTCCLNIRGFEISEQTVLITG